MKLQDYLMTKEVYRKNTLVFFVFSPLILYISLHIFTFNKFQNISILHTNVSLTKII